MRIAILGCGYVGLVTGACLADTGHEVVCTDSDRDKIRTLLQGASPIYEAGLSGMMARNVIAGRLRFTPDLGEAVRFGDAIFLCVGTPPQQDGDPDLSAIDSAARIIATEARRSKLVIEKSTVPTQTGKKLKRALMRYARHPGCEFSVASNPEFLREGTAVEDFLHPDRIVIGVDDERSEAQLRDIYRPIVEKNFACPIHNGDCSRTPTPAFLVTSINSAELIKHACNSFLALKISYANMIADICESIGANVDEVVQAMGMDRRIGPSFLQPGLGFGGFCLPKDIQAFIRVGERAGVNVGLLREVETINKARVDQYLAKARQALWVLKGKRIGILGLAFKPETDDVRFAPSLELIRKLQEEHVEVQVYDPQAMEKVEPLFPNIRYCENAYGAAEDADAILLVTEWPEFKTLDWQRMRTRMARPLVLDGRNLLDAKVMTTLGFEYLGIGRPAEDFALQTASI